MEGPRSAFFDGRHMFHVFGFDKKEADFSALRCGATGSPRVETLQRYEANRNGRLPDRKKLSAATNPSAAAAATISSTAATGSNCTCASATQPQRAAEGRGDVARRAAERRGWPRLRKDACYSRKGRASLQQSRCNAMGALNILHALATILSDPVTP